MNRRLVRATASAAAVTALGAAAILAGLAAHDQAAPPIPVLAADDNGDASAEQIAILNSWIDPVGWDRIVGDGTGGGK